MSEEEIIQEIEKLGLEEEKEKTVKYLLKIVIEGKKDIIQEKEFFLEEKEKEIEELKAENIELINQRTEGFKENDRLKEIQELKERMSMRKEIQNTILVDKIKTLRDEKIELEHKFEEKEETYKKEIKSLLKEIEELKKDNEEQWKHRCKMAIELDNNVVSKDKIREKIKELHNKNINADGISAIFNITKIQTLEELLEE